MKANTVWIDGEAYSQFHPKVKEMKLVKKEIFVEDLPAQKIVMKTAKQHNAEHLGDYETNCAIPSTKPEQAVCDDTMGAPPGEAPDARCTFVRVAVRSFRMRLLDPDNLVGGAKYFVDGLRYAGIIQGDDPSQITLEVTQQKVENKWQERTVIEILFTEVKP